MECLEELVQLCQKLGADEAQAETMAKQLLKRSSQLAEERNITQIQAMEHLLKVVVSGRMGEVTNETLPETDASA